MVSGHAAPAHATPKAPGVKAVQPGQGHAGLLSPGVGVVFKVDGPDTGGALSVVEHPFDVGAVVPPHVHTLEDEISYVLEGEIGFRSEDEEVVLAAGGYIVKPHGQAHAMWNAGDRPARMIEMITPAGFEAFFRGLVDRNDQGPPDLAEIGRLAESHRLTLVEPDWFPDIVARYGLNPPSM